MRIIAGVARGRSIDAPEGQDTRPTLERVKESVFGSIQFEIYGRNVLDLFAGSGNLGIEALSRGAAYAVFCDTSRVCTDIISNNLKKLSFENAAVYNADYMNILERMKNQNKCFDIVFLDPPYATGLVQNAMDMLCEKGLLNENAIVVAEHSVKQELLVNETLYVSSEKKYRDTVVTILKRRTAKE